MKRYNLMLDKNLNGDLSARMYITSNGEWVKYEDVEKAEHDAHLEGRAAEHKGRFLDIIRQVVECNCQREYEQPTGIQHRDMMFYNAWICPAHGYKRL